MTIAITLPELVVPGRRLGRHIDHDPRSLAYALPETANPVTVHWDRRIPILDQGDVGSCTGNATVGALGTGPLYDALLPGLIAAGLALDEVLALAIYSDAETIDGDGPYPPNDNGSSGLSVAKAAQRRGYVSGYQHATSVAAVHTALASGPVLIGSYWYSGMDDPTSEGVVTATGKVRGGHEYLMRGYDADRDLFLLDNSWGSSWGVAGSFHYDTATLTALLAKTGDATSLVPITSPAPTPTPPAPVPTPGAGVTWTAPDAAAADAVRAFAASPHVYRLNTAAAKALKAGEWS